MLVSLTAVAIAAVPPLKSSQPTGPDGYSTYIVAFEDKPGTASVADEKFTSLINSYNGRIIHRYSIINGMAVTIPDSKVDELKAMENVKYVEKDQQVHVLLDKAVPQIGADQAWNSGYTGKGVKVAVIDTGIDGSHPDLNGNKIVGWVDYTQGKTTPYDDHGHGTHVAGTIAGTGAADSGKYKGVAPEASVMGIKVLGKDGSGSNSNILKGIDWAVQNNADIISMSLGSSSHSQASDDAIKRAVDAGVTVIVAAGNSGPNAKTVACPGDSPYAITVGATDRNDQIASFSSRGPTYDGRTKPDVTNMGVGLVAAKATGVASSKPVGQYYQAMSGTSMATPMTSGVAALLLQAKPDLTPAQMKDALTKTAKPLGSGVPNNNYGYGRVDATAALKYVLSGQLPTPSPTPTPTPGPSPTPTPTPGPNPTPTPTPTPAPGNYAVGLVSMFAYYNGQMGSMERFQVTPGTTVSQGMMIVNTGSASDAYSVSVNGIPRDWVRISGYAGGVINPSAAGSMQVLVTPGTEATAGSHQFTVTVRSGSDSTVSSSRTYTLNVAGGRTTPTPTAVPTPNPTSTPVPTPVPEPGTAFTGTVNNGGDYYTYITPAQAGQITAKVTWQGTSNDLDMYLYDPAGKLVAQSQQRYTTSEAIQYNAPQDGYYLLRVHAQRAYQPVTIKGEATPAIVPAYKKTGSITNGQAASYSLTTGGQDVNARLSWNWGFNKLTLALYDASGNKVASAGAGQNTMAPSTQIDYQNPNPGTYTLKVEGTQVGGTANYVLITPYQL
ncbi:S8 family serine peptidase [Methanocella sp. MCL-LM]|uniref:S8 family serine peptidase n=1 Tax=Methanocella sp. MCL-LM TaxID=3412035 RepID=UPI003C736EF7